QPLPHDQLGTPSPDVHDEAPPGLARRGMRNAEIHEPRFFDARDNFDGKSERGARAIEERAPAARSAERVRADDANARRLHVGKSLAESLQALDRPLDRSALKTALLVEPGRETDHLTQTIDDHELPVRITGDDHMEAVRAEIDGGYDIGDGRHL